MKFLEKNVRLLKKECDEIKKRLINIFENEKKEIIGYIEDKNEISYKTVDEMNIDLRGKIHPILIDLSKSVNKRDVEVEVKDTMSRIIRGLYQTPKNELLAIFTEQINKVYTNINDLLDELPPDMQEEYKHKILTIMNTEIDYSREFGDIAITLKEIWLSLNKVQYEITEYLDEMNELENSYMDTNKYKK